MVGNRLVARRAVFLGVLATLLVASAPVARAADPIATGDTPTTLSLSTPDLNPKPVGYATDIGVFIVPASATGTVTFYDDQGGIRTPLGTSPLGPHPYVQNTTWAKITIPADQAVGTYNVIAVYSGDATYAVSEAQPYQFVVGPRPSVTHVSASGPHDATGATAQRGDIVTVAVSVTDGGALYQNPLPYAGTMTLKIDGTTVATPAITSSTEVPTAGLTLGAHTIRAEFDSTNEVFGDSAAEITLTIVANAVEATGSSPSPTTFYPYKDGYKDTTKLRGTRAELASVTIRIYNSRGKLVRTLTAPAAIGAWSVPWNGRNTAGSYVAAGKYTVKQTVRDALGLSRRLPSVYVTVSAKRIYTHTVTLKQSLSQKDAGSLSSGWLGWKFTLPSATIYKKLVFGVYGKTGAPAGIFGPHDYVYCPATTWNWRCLDPYQTFPSSLSWKSVTGSVTRNRHGTTVRLYAVGGYRTAIAYARVVVTYGVLR